MRGTVKVHKQANNLHGGKLEKIIVKALIPEALNFGSLIYYIILAL